ncbi:odorant receptor coreceptor [Diachasma alloeum]|uniref:Odorant receptor n=1 Tax=Diachasma alloeum TaxID=454923 RepID=A0A4E0S3R1_9HYME|nr:odorant receptor coreceptor [Diachasma alloeum]THK32985.1 odorant receptor 117 [Diachasma alloeum]
MSPTTTELTVKQNHVFPLTKSYLAFNFKWLTILGIWNPYKKGLKYWIYQGYWTYVITVVMAARLMTLLVRTLIAEDAATLLNEFSLLAVELVDTLKYIALVVHEKEVIELSEAFNWERHLPGAERFKHYRNKVVTKALSASRTFTIAIMIALVEYYPFYYYSILTHSDYKVEKLPVGSVPLKYCFITSNFWMAFIFDWFTCTWLGLLAVCEDALIMAVLINMTAQLEILNYRLERCHLTTYVLNDDEEYYESSHTSFEYFEAQSGISSVDNPVVDPNEELINCIKFHQHIKRMLKLFGTIFDKALLPQLFTSLLLITLLLLQMILGQQGNLLDSIIAMAFLFCVLLQLLAFCFGGNFVLVESDRTGSSLHASHWYDMDITFRKNMKIFLGAVRNPMIVSAGGLVDLSAETFKNLLTKGYSGAAVLQNVSG